MTQRIQSALDFFGTSEVRRGKITIAAASFALAAIVCGFLIALIEFQAPKASADDVTTSVTVLNTPPNWTIYPHEDPVSSTSTPTNVGSAVTWKATGTDSNAESYFLLICKTNASSTAFSNAPPQCAGGGANMWARSATTTSGSEATAATTTVENFVFANELNTWYGFVCDANSSLPRCNALASQGNEGGFEATYANSPFVVNHPPVFAAISNDSPVDPGDDITWTATAYDTDVAGVADTVKLYVCKSNDFTGSLCGAGGTWASSTLAASNPATTTTIVIPTQDRNYDAYVFVIDHHGRVATSTVQGFNSGFTVSNVSPSISAATITVSTSSIQLIRPNATSGPYTASFVVTDNNSCLNASSTNEIVGAITSVHRSAVTCTDSSNYNSNNCYAATSTYFSPFLSCSQNTSSGDLCSGATDTTVEWTCTYHLWYNADPTDASTPWTAQNWLAWSQVRDDDFASSSLTQSSSGVELLSFLAFDVSTTSVHFGGLEPGQQNDPLTATTDLLAIGNVGLDEDLYGSTMCTNWVALGGVANPDACDTGGINPSSEIPATTTQKVATSSTAYAAIDSYFLGSSTTPRDVAIRVPKTTSTSSPQEKDTFWGIAIPIAITLAGNYTGENTITAKVSNFLFW